MADDNNGVTLDFSKAQPIDPAARPNSAVTLDFSKAQAVTQQPAPTPQSIWMPSSHGTPPATLPAPAGMMVASHGNGGVASSVQMANRALASNPRSRGITLAAGPTNPAPTPAQMQTYRGVAGIPIGLPVSEEEDKKWTGTLANDLNESSPLVQAQHGADAAKQYIHGAAQSMNADDSLKIPLYLDPKNPTEPMDIGPKVVSGYKNFLAPAAEHSADFLKSQYEPQNAALLGAFSAAPAIAEGLQSIPTIGKALPVAVKLAGYGAGASMFPGAVVGAGKGLADAELKREQGDTPGAVGALTDAVNNAGFAIDTGRQTALQTPDVARDLAPAAEAASSAITPYVKPALDIAGNAISKATDVAVRAIPGIGTGRYADRMDQPVPGSNLTRRDVYDAATANGVNLDLQQATGAPTPTMIKRVTEDAILSSPVVEDNNVRNVQAVNTWLDNLRQKMGFTPRQLNQEDVGNDTQNILKQHQQMLVKQAQRGFNQLTQEVGSSQPDASSIHEMASQIVDANSGFYDKHPELMPKRAWAIMQNLANGPQPPKPFGHPKPAGLVDTSSWDGTTPKEVEPDTWSELQQLRSQLLHESNTDPLIVGTEAEGWLKQMVGHVDDVMTNSISTLTPAQAELFRESNDNWRQMKEMYDTASSPFYRIVRAGSGTKAYSTLSNLAPQDLRKIGEISPQAKQQLRQVMLEEVLDPKGTKVQDPRNITRRLTDLEQMGSLFSPHELRQIALLGRVSDSIDSSLNRSGSGKKGVAWGSIAAPAGMIGAGIATGNPLMVAAGVGQPFLQRFAANRSINPSVVERATRAPGNRSGYRITPDDSNGGPTGDNPQIISAPNGGNPLPPMVQPSERPGLPAAPAEAQPIVARPAAAATTRPAVKIPADKNSDPYSAAREALAVKGNSAPTFQQLIDMKGVLEQGDSASADVSATMPSAAEQRFAEEPPKFATRQPSESVDLKKNEIDKVSNQPAQPNQASGEITVAPQARLASRDLEAERENSRVPAQRVAEDGTTAPGRADESVRLMDPKTLRLNPAEMQWRTLARNSIDPNEPYDQTKAGILDIWWNPDAKQWQVVEGHHRANKALATNTPEVRTQIQHFADLKEARQWGALRNIENGNATALDAALYFRDSGDTPETLKAGGVNLKADLVQKAQALSQLSNTLWEKYRTGELDEAKATAIGQHLSDPSQQAELAKLATKHNMSAAEIEQAARRIREAGSTTQDNMGLFGNSESSISNFVATAKLSSQLEKQLQSDKVALSFIANAPEARRQALARGDNSINVSKSSEEALLSASLAEGFKRLQNRTGPVSRLLDEAGARITQGEKRDVVYNETYPKIRDAILNEIGGQAGGLPSDNRQGGGQDSGSERSNSARNEDNAGAGPQVGNGEEPIKGPPEGGGDLFRPKATQPGGLSDGKNAEATYKPASTGRPSRVELNGLALDAVADTFGFQGRFEGLRTDTRGARDIAKKLEANGDEVSRNIASVIRQAAEDADPSQGVVLYQKGNPLAEAEETVHAGQASAGHGELVAGVPHETMQDHPAFQAMAERIKEEVGDQQFTPMIHVAEGFNDLLNDEAPEHDSAAQAQGIHDYLAAVHAKTGDAGLAEMHAAITGVKEIFTEAGYDVPNGVTHAERSIQTIAAKSAESQGITAGDVLRLDKRGPGQNAGDKEADRDPKGDEDLKRPMGQGTVGSEMDGWLRSAKSLTVEPAGEQVGLFGDAEPMHRIVRTDAEGNTERTLVTESQLAQLQKQPAYRRAAAQGRQQGLFGTSQDGELVGNGNRGGMSLPPQKSSNQDTLFRPRTGTRTAAARAGRIGTRTQ